MQKSILMTRHYPDLGSSSDLLNQISYAARPITSTTQNWIVTRHQYGTSALVSLTSFGGETSGNVAKCRLFSQSTQNMIYFMYFKSCKMTFSDQNFSCISRTLKASYNIDGKNAFDRRDLARHGI